MQRIKKIHFFHIFKSFFYTCIDCTYVHDCTNTPALNKHVNLIIISKERCMTAYWYWIMLNICRAFLLVLNVNDVHFTCAMPLRMNIQHYMYIGKTIYYKTNLTNNSGAYAINIDVIMHIVQLSNLIQIWSDFYLPMPIH